MYPRFSETFIVNEIRELERQGCQVEILSLRRPADGKFHPAISEVKAQAAYAPLLKLSGFGEWLQGMAPTLRPWKARLGDAAWKIIEAGVPEPLERFHEALFVALAAHERGIQHLHAHFATSATEAAMLASTITGIPFSFTAHAKDIFRRSVSPTLFRSKVDAARFVVTVTDFNRRYVAETLGADASKVRRIYNGLDLDYFSPNGAARERDIVSVGRLVEKKGFTTLVEACDRLRRRGTPFRCLIVGEGELREPLARRIRELGLDEHVRLEGPQHQDHVRERLRSAALVALPCQIGEDGNQDALPTVLLEALAVGTPAVATNISGVPEIIDDGVTGLLVSEKDPDALADALDSLLGDPKRREQMGQAGRQVALKRFDVRRSVSELHDLFREHAAKPGRGGATT